MYILFSEENGSVVLQQGVGRLINSIGTVLGPVCVEFSIAFFNLVSYHVKLPICLYNQIKLQLEILFANY